MLHHHMGNFHGYSRYIFEALGPLFKAINSSLDFTQYNKIISAICHMYDK